MISKVAVCYAFYTKKRTNTSRCGQPGSAHGCQTCISATGRLSQKPQERALKCCGRAYTEHRFRSSQLSKRLVVEIQHTYTIRKPHSLGRIKVRYSYQVRFQEVKRRLQDPVRNNLFKFVLLQCVPCCPSGLEISKINKLQCHDAIVLKRWQTLAITSLLWSE